jgi:hypothetical protein
MFYYQICDISKWIFAIRMASEIIKSSNSANIQGIVQSLVNGGFSYASLYAIIDILDAVQANFK